MKVKRDDETVDMDTIIHTDRETTLAGKEITAKGSMIHILQCF